MFSVGIKGFRQDSALIFDPLSSAGKAAPYRWCLGCLLRFTSHCHKGWKSFSNKTVTDIVLILFCRQWSFIWWEDSPAVPQQLVRSAPLWTEAALFPVVYRAIVPTNITPPTCQRMRGVTHHTTWTRIHYIPQRREIKSSAAGCDSHKSEGLASVWATICRLSEGSPAGKQPHKQLHNHSTPPGCKEHSVWPKQSW